MKFFIFLLINIVFVSNLYANSNNSTDFFSQLKNIQLENKRFQLRTGLIIDTMPVSIGTPNYSGNIYKYSASSADFTFFRETVSGDERLFLHVEPVSEKFKICGSYSKVIQNGEDYGKAFRLTRGDNSEVCEFITEGETFLVDQDNAYTNFNESAAFTYSQYSWFTGQAYDESIEVGASSANPPTVAQVNVSQEELEQTKTIFDWAESIYPDYFSPSGQINQYFENWTYRYYPGTNNYLGYDKGDIYLYGPLTNHAIQRVDSTTNLLNLISLGNDADTTQIDSTSENSSANCAMLPLINEDLKHYEDYRSTYTYYESVNQTYAKSSYDAGLSGKMTQEDHYSILNNTKTRTHTNLTYEISGVEGTATVHYSPHEKFFINNVCVGDSLSSQFSMETISDLPDLSVPKFQVEKTLTIDAVNIPVATPAGPFFTVKLSEIRNVSNQSYTIKIVKWIDQESGLTIKKETYHDGEFQDKDITTKVKTN